MIGAIFDRVDAFFDRRFASRPGWIVLTELFVGLGWARAVAEKLVTRDWWRGDVIDEFVTDHEAQTLGWFRPVLDGLVMSNRTTVAVVVVMTELFIAISLLAGKRTGAGVTAATLLNVSFLLTGAATPSAFYLVLQLALGLWIIESSVGYQTSTRLLRVAAVALGLLVLACVPYVETINPDRVIEDPAVVLSTWAACGVVASCAARRRVRRTNYRQVIDLRTGGSHAPRHTAANLGDRYVDG